MGEARKAPSLKTQNCPLPAGETVGRADDERSASRRLCGLVSNNACADFARRPPTRMGRGKETVEGYLLYLRIFVLPGKHGDWVASMSRVEYIAMWTDIERRTRELFSQTGRNRLAQACAAAEREKLERQGKLSPTEIDAMVEATRHSAVASLEAQTGDPCTAAHLFLPDVELIEDVLLSEAIHANKAIVVDGCVALAEQLGVRPGMFLNEKYDAMDDTSLFYQSSPLRRCDVRFSPEGLDRPVQIGGEQAKMHAEVNFRRTKGHGFEVRHFETALTASGNEMARSGTSRLAKVGLRVAAFSACFHGLSPERAQALRVALFASDGFEGLTEENVHVWTAYSSLEEMAAACAESGWLWSDEETPWSITDAQAAREGTARGPRRKLRESELPMYPDVDRDGMLLVGVSFTAEQLGVAFREVGRCLGMPPSKFQWWGLRKFSAENVVREGGAKLACRFLQHRDVGGQCLNRVYRNSLNNTAAGGFVTQRSGAGETIIPVSVLVGERVPATARVRGLQSLPEDAPERLEISVAVEELRKALLALDTELSEYAQDALTPYEISAGRKTPCSARSKQLMAARKADALTARLASGELVREREGVQLHLAPLSKSGYTCVFRQPRADKKNLKRPYEARTKAHGSLGWFEHAADAAAAYARHVGEPTTTAQTHEVVGRMFPLTKRRRGLLPPAALPLLERRDVLQAEIHRVHCTASDRAVFKYVRRLRREAAPALQQNYRALRRVRTTPHQWPLEMSEVSSTVFGLERADFTREARLLDKVSGSVRDAVLGFGLMGVLRGLPKTATTQQVWDTIRESDQLVVVCEACSRDDVTATSLLPESACCTTFACTACGAACVVKPRALGGGGVAATVRGVSREAYYPWLRHGSGSWLISGIQAEIEARELQAELAAAEMRANAQTTTSVASSSAVPAGEEITELALSWMLPYARGRS